MNTFQFWLFMWPIESVEDFTPCPGVHAHLAYKLCLSKMPSWWEFCHIGDYRHSRRSFTTLLKNWHRNFDGIFWPSFHWWMNPDFNHGIATAGQDLLKSEYAFLLERHGVDRQVVENTPLMMILEFTAINLCANMRQCVSSCCSPSYHLFWKNGGDFIEERPVWCPSSTSYQRPNWPSCIRESVVSLLPRPVLQTPTDALPTERHVEAWCGVLLRCYPHQVQKWSHKRLYVKEDEYLTSDHRSMADLVKPNLLCTIKTWHGWMEDSFNNDDLRQVDRNLVAA